MKKILVPLIFLVLFAGSVHAFTGTLKFRSGNDTYQVFVDRGKIVSGWAGSEGHPKYAIVGGWYDGKRLVFMLQANSFDIKDKWFSHVVHAERQGNELWLKKALYGFNQWKDSKPIPYILISDY